jgi:hypothetical protein
MPSVDAGAADGEGLRRRWCQRVEFAGAVTAEDHHTGWKILDRETERVKLHRNVVVTC